MIEWQGKYVCAHCGEEFTRTVYLRKKYMNGNEVMITVKCPVCGADQKWIQRIDFAGDELVG